MVIGAIFAGGIGSRMGSSDIPKQYLLLGTKPIIVHTVEKFYVNPGFDKIIVLCPKPWTGPTRDMLEKSIGKSERVLVVEGGKTRNDTLSRALACIEERFGLDDETVVVTHDAVRPFVTHRILDENIKAAKKYGACDTVIPASDTIVESEDSQFISHIPERKRMFQGQTPQSFRAKKLREVFESLTEDEKAVLTDACKIFTIKGEPVYLVEGEVFNIKITYPYDLKVARVLLEGAVDHD